MTRAAALNRLSLNQASIPGWTALQAIEGCVRAGLACIGLWRERVAEVGVERAGRAARKAGLNVSSLCRGGWFPATDAARRRERMDDNRRAVEEAASLGAGCLVLVCGGIADRDLDGSRRQVAESIAELTVHARKCGVRLAIEPLHPMYCADRSVVTTLAQALTLADAAPDLGVIVDAYHVWWDPELWNGIDRAAGRIFGFHVSDWLVPTADILNGRGLMGDGVIDLRRLRRAVDATGYDGPIEVEIFNREFWALPPADALELITRRFLTHVVESQDDMKLRG